MDYLAQIPEASAPGVLYIADANLNIVHVNNDWNAFALKNNSESLTRTGWNPNLLDNFSGSEKVRWTAIYRALLQGKLDRHTEQFKCPSPGERRTFKMSIEPILGESGQVQYLVHRTTRLDETTCSMPSVEDLYRSEILESELIPTGLRSSVQMEPLEEAGGDFVCQIADNGVVDIVMGDFMGHGKEAAEHAVFAVQWLRGAGTPRGSVYDAVRRLNVACFDNAQHCDSIVFATGLYIRATESKNLIEICSFGHASPIFSRAGEIKMDGGMPAGLMRDEMDWPVHVVDLLTHGRRFLTYSDGISEQFNEAGEMFGSQRIADYFRGTLDGTLDTQAAELMAKVDRYRGEALIKDDRTVVVLELPKTRAPGRAPQRSARRAGPTHGAPSVALPSS